MAGAKPWQIVVLVAALVALIASVYLSFFRGDKIDLRNTLRMADVRTGEVFRLNIGRGGAMIPGENPKTKEVTLMPVVEQDGKLVIPPRYLPALKAIPGEHPAVDPETGEVRRR